MIIPNSIRNSSKAVSTVENDMASLGKYTLPKMLALLINVVEFLLRHDAKKFHSEWLHR